MDNKLVTRDLREFTERRNENSALHQLLNKHRDWLHSQESKYRDILKGVKL